MENKLCLNCSEMTTKHFCANCGQKTDTHRITLKHFLLHDLLHGVWHFEKGILFTVKETFVRPGQAALDYISGKRARYYNVFYLCLLLIGLNLVLSRCYTEIGGNAYFEEGNSEELKDFFSKYLKLIVLGIVPLMGLTAFVIFRRLKLNIAEHFILGGIALLGILVLIMLFNFINFINQFFESSVIGILEVLSFFVVLLFPIWVYWNSLKDYYGKKGKIIRVGLFYLLVLTEVILILIAILSAISRERGFEINI